MKCKKTHLIYLDKDGYVWMQEHNIGNKHPQNAEFYYINFKFKYHEKS